LLRLIAIRGVVVLRLLPRQHNALRVRLLIRLRQTSLQISLISRVLLRILACQVLRVTRNLLPRTTSQRLSEIGVLSAGRQRPEHSQ
jgi:hypothetical protein